MSQKVSEITAKICSQNSIADASFSACPWRLATAPASMEVGIDCCMRSTNWNILSLGGRNPNLSAVRTTTIPTGGNKNSLVNVIAIVDRMPNCELPGPPTKLPPKTNIIQGTIAPLQKPRQSKEQFSSISVDIFCTMSVPKYSVSLKSENKCIFNRCGVPFKLQRFRSIFTPTN
jgi:hypothetical protein